MPRYKDDGLPRCVRWCAKVRKYYYQKRGKRRIWLGATITEMWVNYDKMFDPKGNPVRTVARAAARFRQEEVLVAKISEGWRKIQLDALEDIVKTFGEMDPVDITPLQAKVYLDMIVQKSIAMAHQYRSTMKNLFNYMMVTPVVKGDINSPAFLPFYGDEQAGNIVDLVKLPEVPTRKHYPTDDEFWAMFKLAPIRVKIAMLIIRGTGMRIADVLVKTTADLDEKGLKNTQKKRRQGAKEKKQLFAFNGYIRFALEIRKELDIDSDLLIPNTEGKAYTPDGFASMWYKRMVTPALEKNLIPRKFGAHSLRHMAANDQETPEQACAVLGNTLAVAKKHYWHNYTLVKNDGAPQQIADEWREHAA